MALDNTGDSMGATAKVATTIRVGSAWVMEPAHIHTLILQLMGQGYCVIGPTVRDEAIVYDEIKSSTELPIGWTDEQDGGTYRLKRRNDAAMFGYAVGPHAWKKFLHPPVVKLWNARRNGKGFEITQDNAEPPKHAFFGVRSCEIHAMAIQDKVFLGGAYVDPIYSARRENAFVVAVQCAQAGGTCFCSSMKTGPKAKSGFDIALTEMIHPGLHTFLVEIGTARGAKVLEQIPLEKPKEPDIRDAENIVAKTAERMGRKISTEGIRDLLYRHAESPRWEQVASRCLSCANCTMVCPTCFCTTVEDVTDLTGDHAERWRKWDSCFTMDFSYLHGGSVRSSTKSRYRQWITHKLAAWMDQFGTSGCVGCGRCISWCPVGIDITQEIHALREEEKKEK